MKFSAFALIGHCVLGLSACSASEMVEAASQKANLNSFNSIYEPSGALTLPDGNVLIVQDESRQALSLWTSGNKSDGIARGQEFSIKYSGFKLGQLEDLEGIATDDRGHVYVTTSHSRTLSGKHRNSRKKLVRFDLSGSGLKRPVAITNLRKKILNSFDDIKSASKSRKTDFNIEGLSYHRSNQSLMIGFRTPVINDKAAIVSLTNPDGVFSDGAEPRFSEKPILLKLEKGGIRAIAYDPLLKGYLILSRREDKKDRSYKLWLWSGERSDDPKRVRFENKIDLDHAEGIAPVKTENTTGLLIVFDDGGRAIRKGGHYLIVSYDQLKIGDKSIVRMP